MLRRLDISNPPGSPLRGPEPPSAALDTLRPTAFGFAQAAPLRLVGAPVRASDVTDSLGAMGGSVGAQVDVADVNRSQLEVLKQILEKISAPGRLSADAATPLFDQSFYQ